MGGGYKFIFLRCKNGIQYNKMYLEFLKYSRILKAWKYVKGGVTEPSVVFKNISKRIPHLKKSPLFNEEEKILIASLG